MNPIVWGLLPRKALIWAVVKNVQQGKKSFGFSPVLYFHFPSVLLSSSLEEGISGSFQPPARFCSAAGVGKSSHCLHLRHNRVPQTGKLEQATPAPPAVEVFLCDLWKHPTADPGFGILGPCLLNSIISDSICTSDEFPSYQEPTNCFSEDCFLQTPLFVCPRVLAPLEEPDI